MTDANSAGAHDPLWLPPKPPPDRSLTIAGAVIGIALTIGLVFSLFGPGGVFTADAEEVVTIGTTEASADFWPVLQQKAREEGIEIRPIGFSDFSQPNPALAQGQTDLNLFQHLFFLANYNAATGATLTPIGSTVIVPLGLYSQRYDSVAAIPTGAQIAIPNDQTNQARALLVLQSAGLISLRGGGSPLSIPADIDTTASRVTVVPVAAQQTVTSLPSVAAAVINNGFAMDANIDPSTAIYADDPANPDSVPYINSFVARAEDKDDETYLRIVELYHSPEVISVVREASRDTAVIVRFPTEELQQVTGELETEIREAG